MKIFGWDISGNKGNDSERVIEKIKPQAHWEMVGSWVLGESFNGEKSFGEIGPIKDYYPDFQALRLRSWQAFIESEIVNTVVKKMISWQVGHGLKLQSEPSEEVLISEGIEGFNVNEFTDLVESRFGVYCRSKLSDHSNMSSFRAIQKRIKMEGIIGGDVLVLLRYDLKTKSVRVQTIDGAHLQSPMYNSDFSRAANGTGNVIRHGVEMSPSGEHIAYYVRQYGSPFDVQRIPAKDKKSGLTLAYLYVPLPYRLGETRGLPLLSVVLETLKKLDRYKEATVGSAEERAKIAYSIEHQLGGSDENPFADVIKKAHDTTNDGKNIPVDSEGNQLANKVIATTKKQVVDMPEGRTLKALESDNELHFKDFYDTNMNIIFAALSIPPDVAKMMYNSNYSASRAAIKDWEHTLIVDNEEFGESVIQPVYNMWLHTEILKNKIQVPGYFQAFSENNEFALEAFRKARFIGPRPAHIDPVKEVNAERAKLGKLAVNMPLTSVDNAVEQLNGGDSRKILNQFSEEYELFKKKVKQETVNNNGGQSRG